MFDMNFQAFLADTEESLQIHYKLRYQVYCLDKGFEDANNFSNEMEVDEHDRNSVHFIIKDKTTGAWLATMRLVIAQPNQLPMRKLVTIDETTDTDEIAKIAEISRLSIIADFRQSSKQHKKSTGKAKEPEIIFGLIRAAKAYCQKHGIKHWLFLSKRSLARVLQQCGLDIYKIGLPCEHRGARYPYRMDLDSAFDQIPVKSPSLGEMFSQQCAYSRYSEQFCA